MALANQALAARSSTVPAGHIGGRRGFIDEYQPSRIEPHLHSLPRLARRRDVSTILFGRVQAFFEGKAQMAEKPEDRSLADRRLLFRQSRLKLGQGDVRL